MFTSFVARNWATYCSRFRTSFNIHYSRISGETLGQAFFRLNLKWLRHAIFVYFQKLNGFFASAEFQK